MTIYHEALPVAHLTFDSEWRLDYDATWMARRSAFRVSLTMPLVRRVEEPAERVSAACHSVRKRCRRIQAQCLLEQTKSPIPRRVNTNLQNGYAE
jgi:hypothetical protein